MLSKSIRKNLGVTFAMTVTSLLVACAVPAADDPADIDPSLVAAQPAQGLLVAPPAPDGARIGRATDGSLLANAPTISPADSAPGEDFVFAVPGETVICNPEELCTAVWDPTVGLWKVFKLNFCHTYALSFWEGDGFYFNNQTGSPRSVFADQNHGELFAFFPDHPPVQHGFNWSPVWFITNC